MVTEQTQSEKLTYQDYLNTPDDVRYGRTATFTTPLLPGLAIDLAEVF